MVAVHLQISLFLDLQIKKAMAREGIEHMIKKTDSCSSAEVRSSFPVQPKFKPDLCFAGIPTDDSITHIPAPFQ
jgi:hypothetical protein